MACLKPVNESCYSTNLVSSYHPHFPSTAPSAHSPGSSAPPPAYHRRSAPQSVHSSATIGRQTSDQRDGCYGYSGKNAYTILGACEMIESALFILHTAVSARKVRFRYLRAHSTMVANTLPPPVVPSVTLYPTLNSENEAIAGTSWHS